MRCLCSREGGKLASLARSILMGLGSVSALENNIQAGCEKLFAKSRHGTDGFVSDNGQRVRVQLLALVEV